MIFNKRISISSDFLSKNQLILSIVNFQLIKRRIVADCCELSIGRTFGDFSFSSLVTSESFLCRVSNLPTSLGSYVVSKHRYKKNVGLREYIC